MDQRDKLFDGSLVLILIAAVLLWLTLAEDSQGQWCQPRQQTPTQPSQLQGPPGPAGKDGAPGRDATVDYQQLLQIALPKLQDLATAIAAGEMDRQRPAIAAEILKQVPKQDVKQDLDQVLGQLTVLANRTDTLQTTVQQVSGTVQAIRVPDVSGLQTRLDDLSNKASGVAADTVRHEAALTALEATVTAISGSSPAWLTALSAGGPAGIGLALGLAILGRVIKSRLQDRQQVQQHDGRTIPASLPVLQPDPCAEVAAELAALERRVEDLAARPQVVSPAPPAAPIAGQGTAAAGASAGGVGGTPQTIVVRDDQPRQREFVEVVRDGPRLVALQKAMDEWVKRNPDSQQAIKAIEVMAKQYESGMRKPSA